ncbi:MAG: hypothetical protein ACKO85_02995 [Isosphaeraceae bacterium]
MTDRNIDELALILVSGLVLIFVAIINPKFLQESRRLHAMRFFLGKEGSRLYLAILGLALIAFAAIVRLAKL